MKTFAEYLAEQDVTAKDLQVLSESLVSEWTPELEAKVDAALEEFTATYMNEDGTYNIEKFNDIKVGDVIAIVEAMKVMNEVKSEHAGIVTEICVEGGTFVDANTVIMKLK